MTAQSEGKDNSPSSQPPVADSDIDLLLRRGHITPYNVRKEMGWDRTAYSLNTDLSYSGLMDLQGSLEAQSSYWTSPRRSPILSPVPHHAYSPSSERASPRNKSPAYNPSSERASLRHKSPACNAKPSGSAQAHRISPSPNKDFPHGNGKDDRASEPGS
ncbi:hypothetical protein CDL15_Pgr013231 [Punica granatum]|uniref:Uncharacterized protein n=1 Tax=Punica granatum TaxID=22663 RepID=A0A218WN83_PUNGR|nr:hypothetical protein CDL15_Pgr013231 [Punica granatum]